MKIMATSFKRSHARSHSCAAGLPPALQQATTDPHLHGKLLDAHAQVWVSLLWGHCSFLLDPDVHKVLFVPSKSLFPQSCVSSGNSVVGLMETSSKRAYAIPKSAALSPCLLHPEPLPLWQSTADPYLHRRHSNTVLSWSLWCLWVLVRIRCVWFLWASLAGMGFNSKRYFIPPTVLLGLLLCPWTWSISSKLLQRLPSCWGFSALGMGYLPTVAPVPRSCSSSSTAQPLPLFLQIVIITS